MLGKTEKSGDEKIATTRVAIVGFGLVGQRHALAIKETENVHLCAVVDKAREAVKKAENIGVPCFKTLEELIECQRPDGIILSTPTTLHAVQGKVCIELDIPVLIEKPIADNLDEAAQLVSASAAANVPILVGHHRRFNPIIESAHQMISSGVIGDVKAVHATCWFYKPNSYFDKAPWRKKTGAGPVSVNLVHDIDLIRHLCGEITHIQAASRSSTRGYANEELSAAILQFENGGIGTVSVSDSIVSPWSWEYTSQENPVYPYSAQSSYQIGGSKGALSVPDLAYWRHDKEPDWWSPIASTKMQFKRADPLIKQIEHFARVIRGYEDPLVSGHEGLRTLAVINAIHTAAQTGRAVSVDEMPQLQALNGEATYKKQLLNKP